jgi:hypothetical protein
MSGQHHPDEWHPDTEALAEYQAGLADGRRGRRLAAHVASCDRCASVSDQLAGVSSALASAPAPPLPDAVERRITAALATEAALSTEAAPMAEAALTTEAAPMAEAAPAAQAAAGPRPSRGDGSGPSRGDASGPSRGDSSGPPRRARGGRRLRPAVLVSSAAAAACLVVVGAAFLFGLVHFSSGSSSSSAASSAGAPLSARAAAPAAGAAAGGRAAGGAEKAPFAVTASGTRYEPATLATQVHAELTARETGRTSRSPASAHLASPSTPGPVPYSALAACVLRLTGQVRPSLVDWATYQGKPAYVIAVPSHAWVVDCTASDSHLIRSIGL